jgi:hypothetical protein
MSESIRVRLPQMNFDPDTGSGVLKQWLNGITAHVGLERRVDREKDTCSARLSFYLPQINFTHEVVSPFQRRQGQR